MQKKIEQFFFIFEILVFELFALKPHFYWERILFIGVNMLINSVKIWDTIEKKFFELIVFGVIKKCDKNTAVQI